MNRDKLERILGVEVSDLGMTYYKSLNSRRLTDKERYTLEETIKRQLAKGLVKQDWLRVCKYVNGATRESEKRLIVQELWLERERKGFRGKVNLLHTVERRCIRDFMAKYK